MQHLNLFLFLGLMAANFPIYRSMRHVFFEDKDSFKQSMANLFNPNILSFFKQREDMWGEFKGFGFVMTCITLVLGQYILLTHFFL